MNSNIINVFNNESEQYKTYLKKFYWNLKDIFNDYWDNFLVWANDRNLDIKPIVIHEVNKMREHYTNI